jgi:lipopolysaccharide/colanic/teichoic acid biosynthesis glycosyltransferase
MIKKFKILFISEFIEKIFAIFLIILFLPLFLIISSLIFLIDGKEIFFSQIRVGLNAKYFKLYKFRTMRINSDNVQITSLHDPRITNLGKILRKFKLDELPQLFNIVNGSMSFVGYRPEVPKYVDENNHLWKEVLKLKPGITSKVTILFRNEEAILQNSTIDKEILYSKYILPFKLILTIKYNKKISFIQKIKTLLDTIFFVIFPSFLTNLSEKDLINFVEGYQSSINYERF